MASVSHAGCRAHHCIMHAGQALMPGCAQLRDGAGAPLVWTARCTLCFPVSGAVGGYEALVEGDVCAPADPHVLAHHALPVVLSRLSLEPGDEGGLAALPLPAHMDAAHAAALSTAAMRAGGMIRCESGPTCRPCRWAQLLSQEMRAALLFSASSSICMLHTRGCWASLAPYPGQDAGAVGLHAEIAEGCATDMPCTQTRGLAARSTMAEPTPQACLALPMTACKSHAPLPAWDELAARLARLSGRSWAERLGHLEDACTSSGPERLPCSSALSDPGASPDRAAPLLPLLAELAPGALLELGAAHDAAALADVHLGRPRVLLGRALDVQVPAQHM